MAIGDGTPEDAVMAMVDSELLDELLGTLDKRARYAIEARFGLLDGERKSFREVGENLLQPFDDFQNAVDPKIDRATHSHSSPF